METRKGHNKGSLGKCLIVQSEVKVETSPAKAEKARKNLKHVREI